MTEPLGTCLACIWLQYKAYAHAWQANRMVYTQALAASRVHLRHTATEQYSASTERHFLLKLSVILFKFECLVACRYQSMSMHYHFYHLYTHAKPHTRYTYHS